MNSSQWMKRVIKPSIFLLCLVPVGLLTYQGLTNQLTANPISDITLETGVWTLRFIVITLCITPLRKLSGWSIIAQLRRMIGLFAFFYGTLHFTTYIWLDQFFDISSILKDIPKRPFILMGFSSFLLLIPLAATSFNWIMKKMGGKRWKWLHRLLYLTAIGGVIHYYWLVKADTRRPIIYGIIVAVLLGYRLWDYLKNKRITPLPAREAISNS